MSPPPSPSCSRSPAPAHSYDGLLDITHGCTGVTVTNSYLHDHWKASLVGHSDNNGAQDVAITVTFALNRWVDLNSRTPSFRFGHGHIFNNVFDDNNDGQCFPIHRHSPPLTPAFSSPGRHQHA